MLWRRDLVRRLGRRLRRRPRAHRPVRRLRLPPGVGRDGRQRRRLDRRSEDLLCRPCRLGRDGCRRYGSGLGHERRLWLSRGFGRRLRRRPRAHGLGNRLRRPCGLGRDRGLRDGNGLGSERCRLGGSLRRRHGSGGGLCRPRRGGLRRSGHSLRWRPRVDRGGRSRRGGGRVLLHGRGGNRLRRELGLWRDSVRRRYRRLHLLRLRRRRHDVRRLLRRESGEGCRRQRRCGQARVSAGIAPLARKRDLLLPDRTARLGGRLCSLRLARERDLLLPDRIAHPTFSAMRRVGACMSGIGIWRDGACTTASALSTS
jgi:hypothetical protein